MSLTAAPTLTVGSAGNIYGSNSLAANTAVSAAFYVGVSAQSGAQGSTTTGSAISGRVQVWSKGGTAVATTNGCQVQVFSTSDGTNYDTVPFGGINFVIANTVSTQCFQSFDLSPGQYKITLTNLDVTNAITVEATLATVA